MDDEILKKNNITPPGRPGSSNKEWPVVFKLASQLKPPVETISLANNDIHNGSQITSLAHYVPDLRNLSLQGNKLRQWRDLDQLSGKSRKLAQLREMIFIGNPLREAELSAGRAEHYKRLVGHKIPQFTKVIIYRSIQWNDEEIPLARSIGSRSNNKNIVRRRTYPIFFQYRPIRANGACYFLSQHGAVFHYWSGWLRH